MGKVKIRSGENKYYSFKVSIPYGKGKGVRLAATNACQDRVSIPYGKGKVIAIIVIVISAIVFQFPMGKVKENQYRHILTHLCINSLWER